MAQQQPLVPDGSASVSSHGEMDYQSALPTASLPQRKKRPGPKRDSKPAPSEKLERNRQAQRTHRERKEQYTKDLELEVMRLKELFTHAARERDAAFQARDHAFLERDQLRMEKDRLNGENQTMRELLQTSGSSSGTDSGYDGMSIACDATRNSSFSATDDPSMLSSVSLQQFAAQNSLTELRRESIWEAQETRGFASDPPLHDASVMKVESGIQRENAVPLTTQLAPPGIDYNELGLDFVLSLERPCMQHLQFLTVRAHNNQSSQEGEMPGMPLDVPDDGENQHISGHALMATAPTHSHIMNDPKARYPTQLPKVSQTDLLQLLNLSSRLQVIEPELPPVKAWIKIMQDARMRTLGVSDFEVLKATLAKKVHCYRFGAVVEEDDITDALDRVINTKEAAMVAAAPTVPVVQPTPLTSMPANNVPEVGAKAPPGTAL